MLPYIVNRFGTQLLPVLFLASILVFMSVRLIPGDPAAAAVGEQATPEAYYAYREQLGLNDPWYEQYFNWIGGVIVGDFGISTKGAEASEIIWSAFPATIELTFFALLVGFGWGTVLGLLAAVNRGGFWDYFAALWTGWNIGVPSFIAGLFYLLVFALQLDLLPAAGRVAFFEDPVQALQHLILPSLALGGIVAAGISRFVRQSVLDTMTEDYIRTARAKGLNETRVVARHALRNGLIPVVTLIGLQAPLLIGGAVILEQIFVVPGMGLLLLEAVFQRDYPVISGVFLVVGFGVLVINLLVDLSYGWLDPKVRHQ